MSTPAVTVEWVVTAPHQRSRSLPRATPWGTVHLKRVGGRVTACGLPTAGWHAFWELTFSPMNEHACRTCARLTRLAPKCDGARIAVRDGDPGSAGVDQR